MKTFGANSLSSLFYYITKISFIAVSCFLGGMMISFLWGYVSYWAAWENSPIILQMEDRFSLCIPSIGFCIKGGTEITSLIPLLVFSTICFYTITLWILSKMFKTFKSEKIFQQDIVKNITRLASIFLIAAIFSFCIIYFSPHSDADLVIGILLISFSLILFFIKEVFKQGVLIQKENNLTI